MKNAGKAFSLYGVNVTFQKTLQMFRQVLFSQATAPHQLNQIKPPTWMMENGAGYYDVVNSFLLCATLAGSHTSSVHCGTE